MAVNWNLALQQTGREALDYMQAFQLGHKAQQEQNAVNQREQARARASQQLEAGDTKGAQQTALAGGDFDLSKAIGSYSEDQRKQLDAEADTLGRFAYGIKSLPKEQREQAFVQAVPSLRGRFSPEEIRQRYDELKGNGWSDEALDGYVNQALSVKDALAEYTKANEQYTLAPGSSRRDAKGNIIAEQPFAPKQLSVSPGETIVEYQPGGGDPASGGAGMSLETVLPAIVQQESGGNYAARNAETGALGAYQVMPATGQSLAQQLGVPWRPDLMAADTPEARAYQDQIGSAAVQEAIQASGGDPAVMASYYHGGSDRSKWGPKTRQYAQEVTARLGGGQPANGPRVIAQGAPKPKDAPSGYRWAADGQTLEPIPGGPGDPKQARTNRGGSMQLRKEFDQLPEVKTFKTVRTAYNQVKSLGGKKNPTASDDIALIFSYMKMLDPSSVVREGEFATAQNAAGIPDQIRNLYNRAANGNRLNAEQRANMIRSATSVYRPARDTYNAVATQYGEYARAAGLNPDEVARRYIDKSRPAAPAVPADIQAILKKYAK